MYGWHVLLARCLSPMCLTEVKPPGGRGYSIRSLMWVELLILSMVLPCASRVFLQVFLFSSLRNIYTIVMHLYMTPMAREMRCTWPPWLARWGVHDPHGSGDEVYMSPWLGRWGVHDPHGLGDEVYMILMAWEMRCTWSSWLRRWGVHVPMAWEMRCTWPPWLGRWGVHDPHGSGDEVYMTPMAREMRWHLPTIMTLNKGSLKIITKCT